MLEINEPQHQALDTSLDAPARVTDPSTRRVEVLLKSEDFDWIRNLLGDEPDAPRLSDPRTNTTYALLPEARYERFKAFFEEDPLSPAERRALLREAGKRAGWDDLEAEMMEFLREAKADADAGRTVPAREFLQSLGQKKKARKA